jgi:cbb3-type cytochrome c oxidase subunit I/cbb3-type cytochrome c oxidase subunit II
LSEQTRESTVQIPSEEELKKGNSVAKTWFFFSVLWFGIFASFGFILAIKFFFPQFMDGAAWDTFGIIRPAHTNGVLFGFVSSGLLGAMLWITPRLCARPLRFPALGQATAYLWNGAILGGIIWIMLGGTQGREYAELPWAIDVAVIVTLIILAVVVYATILARKEKKLYVTLWYYMGTMIWFPIVYFVGNVMWNVPDGALNGTVDAIFNWYYGHNVLGLWFTTLGIPAWYYFIPKLINRPLYSHLLSLIAFFSIAFFYTGVGGHHLLQAPIPEWLKTIAVIMTVLMMVPVLAFFTNIGLTMRGSWHKLVGNPPLQFIFAGFVMYVLGSAQGTLQGLRDTNAFLHFSQWTVGHAHITLLGGFGFLAVGAAFWIIPRITGYKIYSQGLMRFTWWLAFIGFLSFFAAMSVIGLQQNSNWWDHINVVETLPTLRIGFIWRAVSGGLVALAGFLVGYNIIMTMIKGWEAHRDEVHEPVEGKSDKPHSKFLRRSQEEISMPVIVFGGLAVFSVMSFMVVALPYMFTYQTPSWRSSELTTVETEGETLYKTLGCFYCHNQFIRPQDWAMGNESHPGDFYYSVPNFLGTERTGPSLGQIGGKVPTEWHVTHHKDPRSVSPSSIMPAFAFLEDSKLEAIAAYMQTLGSEDLETDSFQPPVPAEYRDKTNPNMSLMMEVGKHYNAENQTYSGPQDVGNQWTTLYEEGKALYTEKCLRCHGCSANGQGAYARQTLAHPANLHERISNFPSDSYHFWRVSEGVPGTAMPPWGWSLDEEMRWKINTYEMSFALGSYRTVSGDTSDQEGDNYNAKTHIMPGINGTAQDYQKGKEIFDLYCAQCHGLDGHGDGPSSITVAGGYINPEPANFEESGSDFQNYGRWVWKVMEGVETTNMPPWKYALSDDEIFQVIFYEQGFSTPEDYNAKWAPLYSDTFARNMMR